MNGFNFDDWANLYTKSPAEFEAARKAMLSSMIAESSLDDAHKDKLRTLLFPAKGAIKDPMTAMADAQKLMWSSLAELQTELKTLYVAVEQDGKISCRATALSMFSK